MKRFICMLCCCSLYIGATYGQNAKRENPIVFYEGFGGLSGGRAGGLTGGVALNYQFRQSLFTARCSAGWKISIGGVPIGQLGAIPIIEPESESGEFAALYGIRYIKGGLGLSLSAGISHNVFREWHYVRDNLEWIKSESAYLGFPYEANIKWFKKEKKRFRIYGIIPVGRPTAFGQSIGFKLFGNISKNSYGGIGLTYGLGYHKKY